MLLTHPVPFAPSSKRTIRLSIETSGGERRRSFVTIDRQAGESDAAVMAKASAEYRRQRGYADRIVAIYV